MSETTIIYNSVTIKNVLTEDIDQQVVADSTGMNPIYVRVTVSCTGILHVTSGGITATIGLSTLGDTLADGYNRVIDDLMQPGRDFKMLVGTSLLFDVTPGWRRPGLAVPPETPIQKRDVNHGPIPSVKVLGITSAQTLKIQFRLVMHLPYVDVAGQSPGGAISFRFWISEDIDGNDWTTERTYHGTLRVRHMGHNVLMELRNNFFFPRLVEGFVRKRISLQQRPNGLELDFTITDKEVYAVPPYPACKWTGHQTMFTPQPGSFLLHSEVAIKLWGDKSIPKLKLMLLAQEIIEQKLHKLELTNDKKTILQYFSIKDTFEENVVECQAKVALVGENRMLINIAKGNFGQPLNVPLPGQPNQFSAYNKDTMRAIYPTACVKGLFLAALQDPLHGSAFPNPGEYGYNDGTGGVIVYLEDACSHPAPNDPPVSLYPANISADQQAAAYTVYRMTTQSNAQFGTIQLPFGKSSGSQSGNASAVLLSMHKPISQMRVRVEAERLMEWPTLPAANEYAKLGATFAPLVGKVQPSAPITSVDSRKTLYHAQCDYTFAQDKLATAFPAGLMPYRKNYFGNMDQPDVYVMPASAFSLQILFA